MIKKLSAFFVSIVFTKIFEKRVLFCSSLCSSLMIVVIM